LQAAAHLTSWPTTSTRDYKGGYRGGAHEEQQNQHGHAGRGRAIDFWSDCDWLPCRDGKSRPVESGTFPLVNGATARVGRLRAYGNAIVPQVAQIFIEAYLES
jgi:DNA (cytosine-5)-methyltransferase 1